MTFYRFYCEQDRIEYAGKRVEFDDGRHGTIVDTGEHCIFILIDPDSENPCTMVTHRKEDLRPT